MSLLRNPVKAGALRTLDHALAQSLRRLDPDTPGPRARRCGAGVAGGVARACRRSTPRNRRLLVDGRHRTGRTPGAWRAALAASPWVGTPDDGAAAARAAPLVLEGGRLYLRRYREYERRLARRLHAPGRRVAGTVRCGIAAHRCFDALFPAGKRRRPAGACGRCARCAASLVLVTGGPGTGKTTTIARLLVLLVAQAALTGLPTPRIALAAPTGRAAERMAESLRAAVARLRGIAGIEPAWLDVLPDAGTTLHRLLGTIPDSPRFRHHADNSVAVRRGRGRRSLDGRPAADVQARRRRAPRARGWCCWAIPTSCRRWKPATCWRRSARPLATAPTLRCRRPRIPHCRPHCPPHRPGRRTCSRCRPTRMLRTPPRPCRAIACTCSAASGKSSHLELAPLADAVRDGDADRALALLRGGTLQACTSTKAPPTRCTVAAATLLPHWRALADDRRSRRRACRRHRACACSPPCAKAPQGARALNARIEAALPAARTRATAGISTAACCWSPRTATATACSTATSASACATRAARRQCLVSRTAAPRRRRRTRVPSRRAARARKRLRHDRAQGAGLGVRRGLAAAAAARQPRARRASWSTPA